MATASRQRRTREIEYPSGDGKPMAETELHLLDMIDTILSLRDFFAARHDVYVGGNLLLYYEEGNPRKHVAPDVLVALNVPKEPPRDTYLVWKERKAPDFVVEITSKSTKREDMTKKFAIYRDILKVSEYFLFDPTEDYLDPPLQGFRLARELCPHQGGGRPAAQPGPGTSPRARWNEATPSRSRDGPSLTDAAGGTRRGTPARRRGTPTRRRGTPARRGGRPARATRNAGAPRPRKPLSGATAKRSTASDARSRPSEADDAHS